MGRLRSRVAGYGPQQTELFIFPLRMLRRMFELKYRESYEQEFSFFALYIVLVCYYVDKMSNEKLAQNLAGNLNILPPYTRQILREIGCESVLDSWWFRTGTHTPA
jgi:hypothetical protein